MLCSAVSAATVTRRCANLPANYPNQITARRQPATFWVEAIESALPTRLLRNRAPVTHSYNKPGRPAVLFAAISAYSRTNIHILPPVECQYIATPQQPRLRLPGGQAPGLTHPAARTDSG